MHSFSLKEKFWHEGHRVCNCTLEIANWRKKANFHLNCVQLWWNKSKKGYQNLQRFHDNSMVRWITAFYKNSFVFLASVLLFFLNKSRCLFFLVPYFFWFAFFHSRLNIFFFILGWMVFSGFSIFIIRFFFNAFKHLVTQRPLVLNRHAYIYVLYFIVYTLHTLPTLYMHVKHLTAFHKQSVTHKIVQKSSMCAWSFGWICTTIFKKEKKKNECRFLGFNWMSLQRLTAFSLYLFLQPIFPLRIHAYIPTHAIYLSSFA